VNIYYIDSNGYFCEVRFGVVIENRYLVRILARSLPIDLCIQAFQGLGFGQKSFFEHQITAAWYSVSVLVDRQKNLKKLQSC